MALKIRMRQHGKRNRRTYRFVVTDARSPREGRYIECLGWYDPFAPEGRQEFLLSEDKTLYWLERGACVTESVMQFFMKAAPRAVRLLQDRILSRSRKRREERRRAAMRRKQRA